MNARPMTMKWLAGGLGAMVLVLMAAVSNADNEPKDLDKIPKAVMDALKAKFPKAKIAKWTKETEDGKVIYDIEFKQDGRKAEADIAEGGAIQNFEKEFNAKDLPKAVTEAVEKKYPKSKLTEVMEITEIKGKKEVHGGFEIVLETAEQKEVEVTIAKDGTILEDSGTEQKTEKAKNENSALERFVQLAGEWTGKGMHGDGEHDVRIVYKVTAGGSAVVETIDPGGDHEMITVIHPDGDALLLTHYCMLGNQPQMKAKPKAGDKKVAFEFVKATNLKSDKDMYMRNVTFTFVDKDNLKTEWTNYNEGKEAGKAVFELKRKK